jgi:osmotically-inducible protein OsmY
LRGADQRPDPEIARDAVAELKTWLPDAWQRVRPVVNDGWVTLEGEVEWNYQRDYAERAPHWIRGIKGISNLIRLYPRAAGAEIRHEIEEAFRRNALIGANRVTVEASGGDVILKGTVRSWAERQEVERVAWATPGVIQVDNQIRVSP